MNYSKKLLKDVNRNFIPKVKKYIRNNIFTIAHNVLTYEEYNFYMLIDINHSIITIQYFESEYEFKYFDTKAEVEEHEIIVECSNVTETIVNVLDKINNIVSNYKYWNYNKYYKTTWFNGQVVFYWNKSWH